MKKIIKLILQYIALSGIVFSIVYNSTISLATINSNHVNFITINSIFAGFLFTSLSIMISISSNEAIIKLERTSIIDKIYRNIILGISFSVASIIVSIIGLIVDANKININIIMSFCKYILPMLEVTLLILTIFQFILAVNNTRSIITVVRNNIKKNFPSKESMKKTLDKIK